MACAPIIPLVDRPDARPQALVRAGFCGLWEALTGEPLFTPLQLAEQARKRAAIESEEAEQSGDCRRIHEARARLRAAALECLKASNR